MVSVEIKDNSLSFQKVSPKLHTGGLTSIILHFADGIIAKVKLCFKDFLGPLLPGVLSNCPCP